MIRLPWLQRARMILRRHGPACIAILSLTLLLRLPQSGESLWLDELHTAWAIDGSPAQIIERARIGNNSPCYFFLPWASRHLFGTTEVALRLPSLLAGTGFVLGLYAWVTCLARSRTAGAVAAVLAAVDPHSLFFALEARPYACVQLLALGQWVAWLASTGQPAPRVARRGWLATSVLLFYLHPTTFVLTGVQLVIGNLLWWRTAPDRRGLAPVTGLVYATLCLPLVLVLSSVYARREAWETLMAPVAWTAPLTLFPLLWAWGPPLLGWGLDRLIPRSLSLQTQAAPGPSAARAPTALDIPWLALAVLSALAAAWALTASGQLPTFLRRYLLGVTGGSFAVAALLTRLPRHPGARRATTLTTILIFWAACGPSLPACWQGRPVRRGDEPWRKILAHLATSWPDAQAPLLVASGLLEADALLDPVAQKQAFFREYCSLPVHSLYPCPVPADLVLPLPNHRMEVYLRQQSAVSTADRLWLLARGSRAPLARRAIEQVRPDLRLSQEWQLGTLFLAEFRKPPPP